jgi:hypothetical protein
MPSVRFEDILNPLHIWFVLDPLDYILRCYVFFDPHRSWML